ncbi:MAG: hypothetical protein FWC00_04165 [Firmicutes bacterium]|nr:hypothetical protein [Bacillota bacterium]
MDKKIENNGMSSDGSISEELIDALIAHADGKITDEALGAAMEKDWKERQEREPAEIV